MLRSARPVCQAEVDARVAMYTEEAEDELLGGRPDFVLDAIDNIHTKVHGPALHPERMAPITPSFRTGNRSRPE